MVTGEGGGGGQSYLGMLGQRRVTPGWADYCVQRQEGEYDGGDRTSDGRGRGPSGLMSVR